MESQSAKENEVENILDILAEVDKHEATNRDYAEGWHAAISAILVRLSPDTELILDYDGEPCFAPDKHADCGGWHHCGPECCGLCEHCGY